MPVTTNPNLVAKRTTPVEHLHECVSVRSRHVITECSLNAKLEPPAIRDWKIGGLVPPAARNEVEPHQRGFDQELRAVDEHADNSRREHRGTVTILHCGAQLQARVATTTSVSAAARTERENVAGCRRRRSCRMNRRSSAQGPNWTACQAERVDAAQPLVRSRTS